MHPELEHAATKLGISLPALAAASTHATKGVESARKLIRKNLEQNIGDDAARALGLDIVAFGSLARQESGPGSDLDYLVVASEMGVHMHHLRAFREAAQAAQTGVSLAGPGASKLFGGVVGAAELVNNIGLDDDQNKSLSRRILLLQESVPLNKPNVHETLTRSVLARYLFDYVAAEPRVPRFLLNDVLRYWRTVAVDYQAKRWDELEGNKWGLRYIKLRSSRKWTFAGTVVSLFMPVIADENLAAHYLQEQFEMPALARIAQLSRHTADGSDTEAALRQILVTADEIVALLAKEDVRKEIGLVSDPAASDLPPHFVVARQLTADLQGSLERLFYSDTPLVGGSGASLGALSRKYLSF